MTLGPRVWPVRTSTKGGSMGSRSRIAARNIVGLALASALCVPAAAIAAQFDYFIKLPGVEGETQDDKHKGQIEILSYSWGATQTSHGTGAGGMGAGKVSMQDIAAPSATSGGKTSKVEAINIKQGVPAGAAAAEGKAISDGLLIVRGANAQSAAAGGVQVAAGDVD